MYIPTFQGLSVGDFIRPPAKHRQCYPFDAAHVSRFYRARNAIYHLFRALQASRGPVTALVPEYNSGNEVLAMRAAGVRIRFYPVGRNAQADPAQIERLCDTYRPDVLYVIHYLGWPQPIQELTSLCRTRGMFVVEDCALALLSSLDEHPLGSFGDWSVFCLYKTLPVPNGALLVENTTPLESLQGLSLRAPGVASVAGRTAELFVQRIRSRSDRVGATLQKMKRGVGKAAGTLEVNRARVGDIGFNPADVDLAMSYVSERLIGRLDYQGIRDRRIRNFHDLADRLRGRASLLWDSLPAGACPLFLPLLVGNKASAAERLRSCGIEALEFWNHGAEPAAHMTPAARFLRSHVLGLPVHQDLTPGHIAHMARHVADLDVRMAA